jgi:hypothetical protein
LKYWRFLVVVVVVLVLVRVVLAVVLAVLVNTSTLRYLW